MTNARIERLTREALGPAKRRGYTKLDDTVLRAVGIVILILTVITFVSWPRGEDPSEAPRPVARASHASAAGAPMAQRSADTHAVRAEYTPIY